jgi:putative FmdB family regulatory protein
MPTYTFVCEECKNKFELFFTIKNYIESPKCESCGSQQTCRSYQDDLAGMCGSVIKADSELKTIGDLANRNRDRLSADQKNHLYHKHNNYKEDFHLKLPSGMTRIEKPKKYGQ